MAKVTPTPVRPRSNLTSDYATALYCKERPERDGDATATGLPTSSRDATAEEGTKRLKDVGDKKTLITSAELGLVHQYRELKLAGQEILQMDFPYRYSSILYACYGNQYKILQLVEREFASSSEELTKMHNTRCWIGKNSAMVAAYQGHLETMLYIVDLDLQGKFGDEDLFKQRDILGKTALDWAASQGHTDTIEVLIIRSLYQLLPRDSTDQLVVRTRWKLVSLLAELAKHCRDYDPASPRRFFQEVLATIPFHPGNSPGASGLSPGGVGNAFRSAAFTNDDDDWEMPAGDFGDGFGDGRGGPTAISPLLEAELASPVPRLAPAPVTTGMPPPGPDCGSNRSRSRSRSRQGDGEAAAEGTGAGSGAVGGTSRSDSGRGPVAEAATAAGWRASGVRGAGGRHGGGPGPVAESMMSAMAAGVVGGAAAGKKAGAGGHVRSDSVIVRPSGVAKDVHITVGMLMDVVTSAHRAGLNCMGVIMYIQNLLEQAHYFEDLVAVCSGWKVQLLDTCRNKVEVQAVLTPTDEDPSEPVGYALNTFDKVFLSHKYIQQIFTEKWDTMGITDYTSTAWGVTSAALSLVASFSGWVIVCPIVIVLRSFLSPVEQFLQRGKVICDSRFPWHVPIFRWLLIQCMYLTFVVLLSYEVFSISSEATLSEAVGPINTTLAVWCVAKLVEELQEFLEEGRALYLASGWNVMDIAMAICYLLHYLLRIGVVTADVAHNVNVLLVVNDLLAAAALVAWFRVVSVLELSSAIGPLIQMMKQMLLQDVTRFALLVVVILVGFSVGMEALFKDVCLEVDDNDECVRYSSWAYDWQKDGLIGGIAFLQYVALGNAQVTDFEQKRVTGIIFYLIFAVITSILLLNLFIAMLADTYTRVSTKAQVEFRYRKACIMASFSRREAISPPFNLLLLVCGFIGNNLRRLVFGKGGFTPVELRKNESTPLFPWYFPQGDELDDVMELQRRVVSDFLRSVRVALVKDRLQADLPILMHHLVEQSNAAQGGAGADARAREGPPAGRRGDRDLLKVPGVD